MERSRIFAHFFAGVAAVAGVGTLHAQIPEQYPKPLIHTAANHPAAHILLISVDGLHAFDLADYIASHPQSTLAGLSAQGVTYTNAHVPWADPLAGFASLVTGGTPISTGILTTHGYDRSLSPAGSDCKTRGAVLSLDRSYDKSKAPLDSANGCRPVEAHSLLRVNTMFEVVHQKIGPTAWVGESEASTELLRGPSGEGVDFAAVLDTDAERVSGLVKIIKGKELSAAEEKPAPVLFGLSLSGIAKAQASAVAYTDVAGSPTTVFVKALDELDAEVGLLVAELKTKKLFASTWIVITAPYGQSRIDPLHRRIVPPADLAAAIKPAIAAHISGGDVALIWLVDSASTTQAVKSLAANSAALGIQDIYSGERLALTFNRPGLRVSQDPRMADIVIQPVSNVIYAAPDNTASAAHGGLSDWDTHVAMLISGTQLTGRTDPTWVPTTQLGPLLLRALGMEKFDLYALHHEHSPALPGIF